MQTLKDLKEKIAALEAERAQLLVEVADLRKVAEAKVASLEAEVGSMRQDAQALRDLLADKPAVNSPRIQILPSSN